MSIEERRTHIAALEQARRSRVVCYVLSDRETFPPNVPGFNPPMQEVHPWVVDLIRGWEPIERLDLVLHTRGGAIETVWPLLSALRQRCKKLGVIVPFRAHSAGTLACLGADELVMGEFAELSPIDPSTGNDFNPRNPTNPAIQLGISVEDVAAYFDLARDLGGLQYEKHKLEVFRLLSTQIHPLALGNVQRVYLLIRRLAKELLQSHTKMGEEDLERVIEALTTRFYAHQHAISRKEVKALLGPMVVDASAEVVGAVRHLFDVYVDDLRLRSPYQLPAEMGDDPMHELRVWGGILETSERTYCYRTEVRVAQRPNFPPGMQVQIPAGQSVPLAQWPGRAYDYGLQRTGWTLMDNDLQEEQHA